ncbi:hypothetical protein ACO0LM_26440 [Undibacterium sp. Di26W]|uniref:hypothetical protein n=1 Tax=Undibacterium sp. Di26W TaxID=3413035 RepID=UPI003BF2FBAE
MIDEINLKAWVIEQLRELPNLPRELADVIPTTMSIEDIHIALADAEASVLAQISEITKSESAS